jgi:hypothetical protein
MIGMDFAFLLQEDQMSKIMRFINVVLIGIIVSWMSLAYFAHKKHSNTNLVTPQVDVTYLPIAPMFTPERSEVQSEYSYQIDPDAKISSALVYLSLPSIDKLSDDLLRLNITAVTSKFAVNNRCTPAGASELCSPNSTLANKSLTGSLGTSPKLNSNIPSMLMDLPTFARLKNFGPNKTVPAKIPYQNLVSITAPVASITDIPLKTPQLKTVEPPSTHVLISRPKVESTEQRNLQSNFQSKKLISHPFVEDVEDPAETRIKKYERMLDLAYLSVQQDTDEPPSLYKAKIPGDKYIIAIGVFAQSSNLERNINIILNNNFPVKVTDIAPRNPATRQLAAGPFDQKKKALEVLNSIKALGYTDAYLQKIK